MALFALLWCLVKLAVFCQCQTYDDERLLLEYLFSPSRYNKAVRPVRNRSMPIIISLSYRMYRFVEMNVESEDACAYGMLQMSWIDEMLTWNASDYGGIHEILPSSGNYWKPNIEFSRQPSACKGKKSDVLERVTVQNDGTVNTVSLKHLGTLCTIDVKLFPFDRHECVYRFFDSSKDSNELILHTTDASVSYSVNYQNPEWIVNYIVTSIETIMLSKILPSVSSFGCSFSVFRRPGFVIIHNIIPAAFILLLSIFTPLIPPDTGERLSYAITTYLATVFMTVSFYENIPNNSLCITIISYDLVIYYAISSLSLIWSIAMVCLSRYSKEDLNIPVFLHRRLQKNKKSKEIPAEAFHNTTQSNSKTPTVEKIDEMIENPIHEHINMDTAINGWYDVCRYLDKVYFVLTWICYIIVIAWNGYLISNESWNSCQALIT